VPREGPERPKYTLGPVSTPFLTCVCPTACALLSLCFPCQLRQTVSAGLHTTDELLGKHPAELDAVQAELPTKAPLADLPSLRDEMEN
jgi:hypothetical protein